MNSNSPRKFSLSPKKRRITSAEKKQYEHEGYLKNLPVFSDKGVSFRGHDLSGLKIDQQ